MRALLALVIAGGLLTAPVIAQDLGRPVQDPVPLLTLDQDQLFTGTQYGQAAIARFETEQKALLAENRRIEAALEAEERELTNRRATLQAEQFRTLAAAFDTKVEGIRKAQDSKSRELTRKRESEQKAFFDVAAPILADMMRDIGAVAIIDKSAVVLSFDRIDITKAAIVRIDAVLGAGDAPEPTGPDPALQPDPAPGTSPVPQSGPPVAPQTATP